MMFAGILSTIIIPKELFPNVSQPTITISVGYNGASVTEMRDEIVKPIEENLAGTPDLQTINSVVQQGQATISATFNIHRTRRPISRSRTRRCRRRNNCLPTNITPPTVNLRDPAESVVVTLALYSKKLTLSELSLSRRT